MFLLNGFRNKVVVEIDGKLMIGKDVLVVVMFGVEEFGFVMVLFVIFGCVMMCVCYLDICLVGVVI